MPFLHEFRVRSTDWNRLHTWQVCCQVQQPLLIVVHKLACLRWGNVANACRCFFYYILFTLLCLCMALSGEEIPHFHLCSSMRLLHDHKAKLVRLTTGRRRKSVGEHQQAPVEFALLHIPIHNTFAIVVVVMPKLRKRDVTRDEDENTMRAVLSLFRSLVCDVVNNIKFMFRNMKLHVGQHENESMLTWRSRCCSDGARRWTKLNSKSFFCFINFTRQMRLAFYSILNQ